MRESPATLAQGWCNKPARIGQAGRRKVNLGIESARNSISCCTGEVVDDEQEVLTWRCWPSRVTNEAFEVICRRADGSRNIRLASQGMYTARL
jgi:hypothetical protein